uniref:Uncharacterized protein n=1 Tax=Sphaerodactylus townsendi TaxID=933632 RepID=A0ACB8FPX9_9SAUR
MRSQSIPPAQLWVERKCRRNKVKKNIFNQNGNKMVPQTIKNKLSQSRFMKYPAKVGRKARRLSVSKDKLRGYDQHNSQKGTPCFSANIIINANTSAPQQDRNPRICPRSSSQPVECSNSKPKTESFKINYFKSEILFFLYPEIKKASLSSLRALSKAATIQHK